MKLKALFALMTVAALGFTSVNAQTIRHAARHQQVRVRQGIRSGELTRGETRNIEKDERGIAKDIHADKKDGTFTKEERKDIKQEQKQVSKEIYRKKHNDKVQH